MVDSRDVAQQGHDERPQLGQEDLDVNDVGPEVAPASCVAASRAGIDGLDESAEPADCPVASIIGACRLPPGRRLAREESGVDPSPEEAGPQDESLELRPTVESVIVLDDQDLQRRPHVCVRRTSRSRGQRRIEPCV